MIRELALVAGAAYAALALLELAQRHIIPAEGALAAALLVAIALLHWASDGQRLKGREMAALWACIALFGLYALLRAGGIL
ncbi:MAG: hypothetical protein KO206_01330 [Methanomicrobiaceae archaeon]|uniref:Uncharacterized protein n=1 Tax=hydrocarbon metagenome TaxID=938273 RepID=A0A0W8FJU1_9ZZZZ|nr:hypothetical protein [Methanomicrobiaceae archaeon]